jgi:MatE
LGLASDFWRVAVIGAIAASLGEEEVAIFNTSYRIMWIVLILVMALAGASGINMTMRLGRLDHKGAKQAGYIGCGMASGFCALVGLIVWFQIGAFGKIFTNDEVFLRLLAEAKTPFCITLVLMNISIAIEKIPYSMGRTQGTKCHRLSSGLGQSNLTEHSCLRIERGLLVWTYCIMGWSSSSRLSVHDVLEKGPDGSLYWHVHRIWTALCVI